MPTTAKAVNIGGSDNDPVADKLRLSFAKVQAGNVAGQPYNGVGDGTTDDRAAIAAADGAMVAAGGGYVVFPSGTWRVASNLTITSPILFQPGAILAPDTGITVTLGAGFLSTPRKIFGGLGAVVFGAGAVKVERFLPQWWGAVADSVTNDVVAIQAAITAAQVNGGRVYFAHSSGYYYIGSTTLNVTGEGVVLEASDVATYIKYSGTGFAINWSLPGASQMNNCGMVMLGVLCSDPAGSAVTIKSPYGFFIDHGYFENGNTGSTGVGITFDPGLTSGGTGYFGTHSRIAHVRVYGFLKQVLFKGGSLAGADTLVSCSIEDSALSSLVGLVGSTGVEMQGAQQCIIRAGNMEVLDYGLVLTSTPNACVGITLDCPRFESIRLNNWVIPSGATNCSIIAPRWEVDNGSDLAADTIVFQNKQSRLNTYRLNKQAITCVNGDNNHTISRGSTSRIVISGPTAAFAIGGFTLDAGGTALTDGTVLEVWNSTAFAMTINNADGAATANCAIRTLSGGNVVQSATFGGGSARFMYSFDYSAWVCLQFSG